MSLLDPDQWHSMAELASRKFKCGFCGVMVGAHKGYYYSSTSYRYPILLVCPNCGHPTFFDQSTAQHPGPMIGREIKNLPSGIQSVYNEIRGATKNSLWTAVVVLGRKLIMHLAVDVAEANEGENFVAYVNHLKTSGFVPPNAGKWLDEMRKIGNEKNHELKIGTEEEATKILGFIEILLIFMYEFKDSEETTESPE